ncbi:hypothetical protein [Rubellimicrobium rubrum]|uniref:hypothetical protein n=1 Tax=Rubellimicrobium rubrum TaxID=2585369 RepID=UPI00159BEC37|nr:hypothetical protein [Rubellimicrobium rubrum]
MVNQTNHRLVEDNPGENGPAWRSIGSLTSAWVARIEAEREKDALLDAHAFVPTAWAAE